MLQNPVFDSKWQVYGLSTVRARVSIGGMKLIGSIFVAGSLFILSSCSLVQQQAQKNESSVSEAVEQQKKGSKADNKNSDEEIRPTPEQMESAINTLQANEDENAPNIPEPAAVAGESELLAGEPEGSDTEDASPLADVIPGGLRMGRFAPPEEAVSSSENDNPAPNSVELHGFRSPHLKGGRLPMNINGKINKAE